MAIKCPKCHSDNPDTKQFCGECGTPLQPSKDISVTKTIETPVEEYTRGTTFATRYEIIEELGKGGMGSVYRVFDKKIEEEVALKLLKLEVAADKKTIERFRNELKFARKIGHRNVCKMYDLNEEEGINYITMEYVPGEDLKSFIKRAAPLSTGKSVSIAKQVCEGLAEAHRLGVVHRDLKPQNIMIDKDGNAKIMDFGIARSLKTKGITGTGVMIGTPEYMSPEQVEGKKVDPISDIYSLGVILYEMATGRVPFEGDTPFSIAIQHKTEVPQNPKKFNPLLPKDFIQVILKCMEKDKTKRYQEANEVLSELNEIEKGIPTTERIKPEKKPITSREITVKFNVKKVLTPAFILVAFAVIVTVVWWFATGKVSSVKNDPKPISILIADFENKTGDPVFDGAIETALNLGLKGASFISSYDRSTALKIANQMDLNPEEQLDSKIAQAVCRREGIDLVLTGSIETSGKGYTIKTWTLYPTKSEKFTEVSQEITEKSKVLKETDKLANQLASKLGGVKLRYKSHSTTTSLEAMNAFSKAFSFEKQGRDQEAIQEYLRAIQKDPRFGKAYGNLAVVYYNLGQEQKAIEYFKMAMMHLDRITEIEKNEIRSKYYLVTRNYKKAIESFRVILKESPREGWARMNLAFAYFFARDMKKAVEEGKKAIELNPKNANRRYNLVWYAMGAGDFELADKEARALLNQNPEFADGYVCFALLELIQGHTVQANEAYQKCKSLSSYGSSYANIGIADLAIYEGRLANAKQILEDSIARDIKNGSTDFAAEKLIMLAQTFLLQGKKALAINTVDRAIDLSKKVSVMFSAAKTFIDAGQGKRATALSEYLAEKIYPEFQAYAKLIEAEVKRSSNDIPGAIRLIEEAKTLVDTWLGRFALGCAYLEAGAFAEAHEELELCIKRRGEAVAVFFDDIPSCRYIPSVYYYLARAQEGMNSPAATESYQKFLKIKENADPGIAEVEDAKKRLAGLKSQ